MWVPELKKNSIEAQLFHNVMYVHRLPVLLSAQTYLCISHSLELGHVLCVSSTQCHSWLDFDLVFKVPKIHFLIFFFWGLIIRLPNPKMPSPSALC